MSYFQMEFPLVNIFIVIGRAPKARAPLGVRRRALVVGPLWKGRQEKDQEGLHLEAHQVLVVVGLVAALLPPVDLVLQVAAPLDPVLPGAAADLGNEGKLPRIKSE